MSRALYQYELEENIDYWYEGLKRDKDEFVFAVTENAGHVAMILIMPDKTIYINEEAREKLQSFWPLAYDNNMKIFIPMMAQELDNGELYITGVKTQPRNILGLGR